MKPFHKSVCLLFAFPFLLTITTLSAQENYALGISLAYDQLPFEELIRPAPPQAEEMGSHKWPSIYDFPNGKDSISGMMDSLSKWHLLYVYSMSRWGMALQNQVHGENAIYISADTALILTGADLCAAFSADSTFAINRKVHTTFNSPDQHEGEWFFTQWNDVLLVKLVRNLSPAKLENVPMEDDFYYKEEYWYFFRRAG